MATPTWDETEEIKEPNAPTWDDTEEVKSPSDKSVSGFLGNAVSDAGQIAGGVASLAGNLATHPIDTTVSTVKGIPSAVKELAKTWGIPEAMHGQFADALKKIGDSVYEKPISRALDVASVAMPALKGAGLLKGVEGADLASQAGKVGDMAADTSAIYRTKNLGARTKAFSELGEDEAIRLGNRAKELELTGGAKNTLAKADKMSEGTGADINQMRHVGDQLHAAPTMDEMNDAIHKHLGDKYTSGLGAGEQTEFNRALEDVNKAKPTTSSLSDKATEMNNWAKNEKSLLRPSGAASDVANVVSGQNDANLVHALGAEQGKTYLDTLAKHSDLETMKQMLKEKRARELGASQAPGSLPAKALHAAQDRFGYRMTASSLGKVAAFLKTNPEKFGKYAGVLNHAMVGGPAVLATTVDLLSQNDPNFAQQMETLK